MVYKSRTCKGFAGYGDADPSNVSSLVRGAEMRVAETRAVNRALRKAYGIGICSVEEVGTIPNPVEKLPPQKATNNGNGIGLKRKFVKQTKVHSRFADKAGFDQGRFDITRVA
jgi:hypothetical protein